MKTTVDKLLGMIFNYTISNKRRLQPVGRCTVRFPLVDDKESFLKVIKQSPLCEISSWYLDNTKNTLRVKKGLNFPNTTSKNRYFDKEAFFSQLEAVWS